MPELLEPGAAPDLVPGYSVEDGGASSTTPVDPSPGLMTALSMAIYGRLTGLEDLTRLPDASDAVTAQGRLATLLTLDPNSNAPLTMTDPITGATRARVPNDSVRQGTKGIKVFFPEVTYRPSAGRADRRFSVDYQVVDMELWDNSESGTVLTDMVDCVQRLLDRRHQDNGTMAPPLPLSTGRCYYGQVFVCSNMFFDTRIKSWFILLRLEFVAGR